MTSNKWLKIVAIVGLALGIGGLGLTIYGYSDYKRTLEGFRQNGGDILGMESRAMANVVKKVKPGVVSIVTPNQGTSGSSSGTGMIVTTDGYILTNRHVVHEASTVRVITDAGEIYDNVSVVGRDMLNDVAYLKIPNGRNLPTVTLGDSKNNNVGLPVWAIGNALGTYMNSVTEGTIAGVGRSVVSSDATGDRSNLTDMIQTDAAINPGNSGGPLVNFAGEVIGINTSVSTNAQVLGFAIPISAAKGMLNNLIKHGKAERAFLGVNYLPVTPEVAKLHNLPVKTGNYVYQTSGNPVVAGSPAERAGVSAGDIIMAVDNVEIGVRGSVLTLTSEHMPGDEIELKILRDGKEIRLKVTLGVYSGGRAN